MVNIMLQQWILSWRPWKMFHLTWWFLAINHDQSWLKNFSWERSNNRDIQWNAQKEYTCDSITSNKPYQRDNHVKWPEEVTSWSCTTTLAFLFFAFPGEALEFYQDIQGGEEEGVSLKSIKIAVVVCNVLQATNMSFNFVLYCIINPQFRKTLMKITKLNQCPSHKKNAKMIRNKNAQEESLFTEEVQV